MVYLFGSLFLSIRPHTITPQPFYIWFLVLFLFPFLSGILIRVFQKAFLKAKGIEDYSNGECLFFSIFYMFWPVFLCCYTLAKIFHFNNWLGDKIADKLTQNSKETKMLEYEKLRLELKEMGVEV